VLDVRPTGIRNVEPTLVGREGEAVGLHEVVGRHANGTVRWVDPIEPRLPDLRRGTPSLVVAVDAVSRVAEPDRAVRRDDDVVRAVEALPLDPIGDDGDRAVVLSPRDPPRQLLAGDEPSLAI